jgi:signal transduction histidine kinase/ligand-binding sensor domain-containing protein/DNA-binding response OmpR family regulator
MGIKKIFGYCLISILIINSAYAQESYDEINFVPLSENISTRAITSLQKDHKGILWIGTQGDGLSSFNGYEYKNYKHQWNEENTLNSSVVNTLFFDSDNNLWVGTEKGLNFYNRNLDQFIDIPLDSLNTKIQVKAIEEIDENSLLVGTHGYGAFKINKASLVGSQVDSIDYQNISALQINSIKTTLRGSIIVGSNIGLLEYNSLSNEIVRAKFTTLKGSEFIQNAIQSMLIKSDGSIWLGTINDGIIEISTTPTNYYEFTLHRITDKRVLSLESNEKGAIFCATENDGLFIINHKKEVVKSFKFNKSDTKGVKSNSIWSVLIDESNRIWIGYFNQGIDIYDKEMDKFKSLQSIPNKDQSLFSKSVNSISQDRQGRFWFGITDGGVDVYDPKQETFVHLLNPTNKIARGLTSSDVVTVFVDSKENTWVGTWNSGLFVLKKGSKRFENIQVKNSGGILKSNRIMSFAEDSKGTIWIGSFLSGLYSYDPKTANITHHQEETLTQLYINSKNIRKVLVDHNDNIWLGTRSGLFKLNYTNTASPTVESFNELMTDNFGNGIQFNVITTVFEDNQKNIWVGTDGYGLCKINPSKNEITWFNSKDNFIQQSVVSITQTQKNNIWFAGNNGITKLDVEKNVFTNFNTQDGLLSKSFNKNAIYLTKENWLFFGCFKGVHYFDPEAIKMNSKTPIVYFSDFKLSNKSIKPQAKNSPLQKTISETSKIKLKHDQSLFTIDFFGLSYTRSKNIEYAYYLEGFESDWNYVGRTRNATYTNIPPGTYNFKVKASNSEGLWSNSPTVLEIEVLAPWWKTNLAAFIFLLILTLIMYGIYKFFNIRLKERNQIKREREERKQIEGLNAKKIQFFTNISHEFRTPLTLILNPLEDIIAGKSDSLSEDVKEKHKIIYKNSKRLSRLIDELMDFRKLQFNKMEVNVSKFDLISFTSEVASHFEEEAMQRNIILTVENNTDDLKIWADPSMLEKIIFNLLSNAFKATKDNGAVTLKIHKSIQPVDFPLIPNNASKEAITISVSDSGIGIEEENLNKIFSRFYQVNELDKQYYGGTGIGLEVVKNFVDLHKGIIEVSSQKNIGTEFKIHLPTGNEHFNKVVHEKKFEIHNSQFDQINTKATEKELTTIEKKAKKTILIVEDNQELRNYIKNELKESYIIKTAENGIEGLKKALKFVPDLIITDIMMPLMDGFEFCEKVKNDLKISHIPLLMMTAKGMQIDKIKGIDSGADAYLTKPFNMGVLKSHVKQLITSRQILFNKYFNGIKNNQLDNTTTLDKQFITTVLDYINDHISDSNLSVENLAEELFLSRSKLYRKIKALTGDTATEFIRKIKLEKAKILIETSDFTVSEICYKVGFSSPSYFTKCFKNHFGILPKDLRNTIEDN